jgi:hypothetical protein
MQKALRHLQSDDRFWRIVLKNSNFRAPRLVIHFSC